jgi:hypothetical protein
MAGPGTTTVVGERAGILPGGTRLRRIGIAIRIILSALSMALTLAVIVTSTDDGPRPGPAGGTTLLVPAYVYPSGARRTDWGRMASAARSIPVEVILNPASGPGTRPDPNYVSVVDMLHRSGARILAYVDSDYGRRAIAAVEEDLRRYTRFYQVDGYFIDQMANTPEAIDYYRSIRRRIRQLDPRLKVVGNPGTITLPAYLDAADTLVIFEGAARSFAAYDPRPAAPWIAGEPPGRFAAIVYGVGLPSAGRELLSRARQIGAGSVYITDQEMPNPYLGLPPYWSDLVAAIGAMNRPNPPAVGPAPAPTEPRETEPIRR